MKLVEAESTGPVEGEDAVVTPPRLPHRRVSVSLLFTLTVLIGTVVTIYAVFPVRNNVLVTEAIERHRAAPTWDLVSPSETELRAWSIGVVGKNMPVPAGAQVVGAARLAILNRDAALLRLRLGPDELTYLVQHARGIPPDHAERHDGDLQAVAWRAGSYTIVTVGADTTAATWRAALKH